MRRNYQRKLRGEIITGNYEEKLSQEIISYYISSRQKCGNYRDTGVSKIKSKRKRGNRRVPLAFRGKRAENCLHNVGKSLGEGLAEAKIP